MHQGLPNVHLGLSRESLPEELQLCQDQLEAPGLVPGEGIFITAAEVNGQAGALLSYKAVPTMQADVPFKIDLVLPDVVVVDQVYELHHVLLQPPHVFNLSKWRLYDP